MPTSTSSEPADRSDADARLVAAALAGDRSALADIYDAYADRIHTMCVHMLGDRDEAADVCGEVFLVAFQRLGQLREPTRLRAWLYAICRHEVYRRTKRRGRVRLVAEVSDMNLPASHDEEPDTDPSEIARVVQLAAAGLDDRDRMVLELQLQGVQGDELAAALGTSTTTSYQLVHRMRERMERSLGALLVARQGRADCADLDRVLAGWDGTFDVLWRKRVARHIDQCDVCERRRRAVPGTLLGTAGASPLVVTPTSVRTRVLEAAGAPGFVGTTTRRGSWRPDGFPPDERGDRMPLLVAAVVVGMLLLVGSLLAMGAADDDPAVVVATGVTTTTTSGAASSTSAAAPDETTTASSAVSPTTAGTSPPTTVAGAPTTRATTPTTEPTSRTTTTASPTTTTTAPPATTTTTAPAPPPSLRLAGPSNQALYAQAQNGQNCSNQPYTATITSGSASAVTLRWTAGKLSGTVAMSPVRLIRGNTTWRAVVNVPFGTAGLATATATATGASGGSGTSNPVAMSVSPCPVIG